VQVQLTTDSTLADLPVQDFQVDLATPAGVIAERFNHHDEVQGVIVTSHQRVVGVISRRTFFEHLGQLYGVAVHKVSWVRARRLSSRFQIVMLRAGL
jgi:hypothetical protein